MALRTSTVRVARRSAPQWGEPLLVSFRQGVLGYGRVVSYDDSPAGLAEDTVRIEDDGASAVYVQRAPGADDVDDGYARTVSVVQVGNLWAHAANAFDDWEPLEPHDVVTALGLVSA